MVLCHDITEIVKDKFKGPAFRKGHVIKSEDVPKLLDLGKRSIYVYENDGTMLHEDDAARILEKVTKGRNLDSNDPKEGKIELTAAIDGLFWSDTDALKKLNSNVEISIASRLSGFPVHKGDKCAGMRVIPLMIKKKNHGKHRAKLRIPYILSPPLPSFQMRRSDNRKRSIHRTHKRYIHSGNRSKAS